MSWSEGERLVLERFYEKVRMTGAPRAGYNLRREAIVYHHARHPQVDFDAALKALSERGFLAPNEAGTRFILTEEGANVLADWRS